MRSCIKKIKVVTMVKTAEMLAAIAAAGNVFHHGVGGGVFHTISNS
jgi:hypothetical protein